MSLRAVLRLSRKLYLYIWTYGLYPEASCQCGLSPSAEKCRTGADNALGLAPLALTLDQ